MSLSRHARALLRAATSLVAQSLVRRGRVALARSIAHTETLENRRLMARATGIDVSSHSGAINWSQVAGAGYSFAYARATEGVGFTDAQFAGNLNSASSNGLLFGAYHHATPTTAANDAVNEANYFVSAAGGAMRSGFLRPAVDLSEGSAMGKAALSTWVNAFVDRVEAQTGVEPIVYTNNDYATNYLDGSVAANRDLWIARWSTAFGDPLTTGSPPTGAWGGVGETWDFWQHTNTGTVPGVSGSVDRDVFNGDRAALEAFVIGGVPSFSLKLDFGPSGASVPTGYVGVGAGIFGTQSGQQMGWLQSGVTTYSRANGTAPDNRYRTYAMPAIGGVSRSFEVAVPNGTYSVRVVAGSPDEYPNAQKITVEGATAVNASTSSTTPFISGTVTVNVTDGRLTLGSLANGAANTRLAFVDIASVDATAATAGYQTSVDFGETGMKAVPGYRTDFGNSYGLRSNGYTFGWIDPATSQPAINVQAGFTHGGGSDNRLNAGIGTSGRSWEIELPDGTYWLKLVAGDGAVSSGTYGYDVEGSSFLRGAATSGGRFITKEGQVTVADGRLTIANAAGMANHALAYLEITPFAARGRTSVTAPAGVVATSAGDNVTDVRWTDRSDNETSFRVERGTSTTGAFTPVGTAAANAGVWSDTSGDHGTTYYYRVVAVKSGGESAPAMAAALTTPTFAKRHDRSPYHPTRANGSAGATIQSEDYDVSGSGQAYSDTTVGNAGGYYRSGSGDIGYNVLDPRYFLGWTKVGEWNEYTLDVAEAGTYRLEASVASEGLGGKFAVLVDGVTKASNVQVPDTESFNVYETIQTGVFTLAAGAGQRLKLLATADDAGGDFVGDFDWFRLVKVGNASAPIGGTLSGVVTSATSIRLSWTDASSDEDGFRVLRSSDGTTFAEIAAVGQNVTAFDDAALTPSTRYYYRVEVFNSIGGTTLGQTIDLTTSSTGPVPVGATSLHATVVSSTSVTLAWSDNSEDESAFRIERRANAGGSWVSIATLAPDVETYSDATVAPGVTYDYRVVSVGGGGDGVASNTATLTTPSGNQALPAATNLAVVVATESSVRVSWRDNAAGESGYRLDAFDATGTVVASVVLPAGATAGTISGLLEGSAYDFRVTTLSGTASVDSSVLAAATRLKAPTDVTIVRSSAGVVSVGWTSQSTKATSYRVSWVAEADFVDANGNFVPAGTEVGFKIVTVGAGSTGTTLTTVADDAPAEANLSARVAAENDTSGNSSASVPSPTTTSGGPSNPNVTPPAAGVPHKITSAKVSTIPVTFTPIVPDEQFTNQSDRLKIEWTDKQRNVVHCYVWMSTPTKALVGVVKPSNDSTGKQSFVATGLDPMQAYSFSVQPEFADYREVEATKAGSATTGMQYAGQQVALWAEDVKSYEATLRWNPIERGGAQFILYKRKAGQTRWYEIGSFGENANSAIAGQLNDETTYEFTLRTVYGRDRYVDNTVSIVTPKDSDEDAQEREATDPPELETNESGYPIYSGNGYIQEWNYGTGWYKDPGGRTPLDYNYKGIYYLDGSRYYFSDVVSMRPSDGTNKVYWRVRYENRFHDKVVWESPRQMNVEPRERYGHDSYDPTGRFGFDAVRVEHAGTTVGYFADGNGGRTRGGSRGRRRCELPFTGRKGRRLGRRALKRRLGEDGNCLELRRDVRVERVRLR